MSHDMNMVDEKSIFFLPHEYFVVDMVCENPKPHMCTTVKSTAHMAPFGISFTVKWAPRETHFI